MNSKEQWETGIPEKGIPPKCPLFSLEIIFFVHMDERGFIINNTRRWFVYNQAWPELRGLRETILTHGLFCEWSPGRGEIILPHDLRKILVDVQPDGFKDTV